MSRASVLAELAERARRERIADAYYAYRASLTRLTLHDSADFMESERLRRAWEALMDAAR